MNAEVRKHLVVYLTWSRYDVIYAPSFFSVTVGVPIYGFHFVGSRICRIIEINIENLELSHGV